jgi:hypothetical protein
MAYVTVDLTDVKDLVKDLQVCPQMIRQATASALNRTLTFVGAETKRQVQEEYAVTKSIQKAFTKKRATQSDLTAEAIYTDKSIPMFVFKHTVAQNQYRSPVTITIKKSNGKQTHNGSNPALFRGYGKKIMRRESGEKNIRTAYTLSIPQMVANDDVYKVIAEKAESHFYKRFEHEVDWRMKKL